MGRTCDTATPHRLLRHQRRSSPRSPSSDWTTRYLRCPWTAGRSRLPRASHRWSALQKRRHDKRWTQSMSVCDLKNKGEDRNLSAVEEFVICGHCSHGSHSVATLNQSNSKLGPSWLHSLPSLFPLSSLSLYYTWLILTILDYSSFMLYYVLLFFTPVRPGNDCPAVKGHELKEREHRVRQTAKKSPGCAPVKRYSKSM